MPKVCIIRCSFLRHILYFITLKVLRFDRFVKSDLLRDFYILLIFKINVKFLTNLINFI